MPQSGDKNTSFGIYKSACCGRTTVILGGETFPDCPKHRHSRTEWIAMRESDEIVGAEDVPIDRRNRGFIRRILP